MTVSYNLDLSRTGFLGFMKLQLRWRGSIWKCILIELIMFSSFFLAVSIVYRTDMFITEKQRMFWDNLAALFDQTMDYIPLTFMLGFFVTVILGRWNDIFFNIGWIDTPALYISTLIPGSAPDIRMLRRNLVRYLVLTQVLIFRDISLQVRKRFPTIDTLIPAGFLIANEKEKFDAVESKYAKYWMPIHWCMMLLYKARLDGHIVSDPLFNQLLEQIRTYRNGLVRLCVYDWVPVPLVYPQVVFLAVRVYFVIALIARQSVLIDGEKPADNNPLYPLVPFFMTALQFIFYVGWMKVAESLMNPLGEDDDDFECNYLLDRNLTVGLTIVEDSSPPEQQMDIFWSDKVEPLYSADTAAKPIHPLVGSVANVSLPDCIDEVLMMPHANQPSDQDEEWQEGCDRGETKRLVPVSRGTSVTSVTRGSVSSRLNNGSVFNRIKRQFSRDSQASRFALNRHSRTVSTNSGIYDMVDGNALSKLDLAKGSQVDILDELAIESSKNDGISTKGPNSPLLSHPSSLTVPPSPNIKSTPMGSKTEILQSLPEEDEDAQKTVKSLSELRKGE